MLAEVDRLIGEGEGPSNTASGIGGDTTSGSRIPLQSRAIRSGKPKEIVGSWADISDRKRDEAELQRLAERGGAAQPVHSRDLRPLLDG